MSGDNSTEMNTSGMYTDGRYLMKTGITWHAEDSEFKARQLVRMLTDHPEMCPLRICEIGCGAGRVLSELQRQLQPQVEFSGYDISPQANQLSKQYENARCQFILGDAFSDARKYDLALVVDVVEHVEDCFSFLRHVKDKARWKMYHIPLETHASAVIRGLNSWDSVGHLHLFTIETALKAIEHSGQRILDWTLTEGGLERPTRTLRNSSANLMRRIIGRISRPLCARTLGGYSILILAE